jgi:hypothetical protein
MAKPYKNFGLFLFTLILCNSCIGFRTVNFKEKNPTSFIFPVPLIKLSDIIIQDFGIIRSKNLDEFSSVQEISNRSWNILSIGEYNMTKRSKNIFINEENKYDVVIIPEPNPIVSYSKIYKKFWKPLKYLAEFELHFIYITETETKIEIITHNPKVLYWSFNFFNSGHSYVKCKTVEPTTIEEYEILLRVGNLVGEKHMPPLKLPK